MSAAALRADARACHAAALAAVDPTRLVAARLERRDDGLVLRAADGTPLGRHGGPVLVVGAGKAARAMAEAAVAAAGPQSIGGAIVVPSGLGGGRVGRVEVGTGAHPVPDAGGVAATARVLAAVTAAGPDTVVVVVLSGGASALLVAPSPGLGLGDKQQVTARLLEAGADIAALNTVRKHCSRVKGGGLVRAARRAAAVWGLVLSDVVGDDPAVIASGPTVPDPTTFAAAAAVLAAHLPSGAVPAAVEAHIARGQAGAVPETPKPGDPAFDRARTCVVGGNGLAVAAAARAAAERGYVVEVIDRPITGDAAEAGRALAARLGAGARNCPIALVGGGETTVRVVAGGRGGRCQQLALAAALVLAGEPGVLLAAGTDGVDGPTAAAGACVDGGTVGRAAARGLDAACALAATDSHPLLAATGDLIVTGPTGTNVADVVVALRSAC
jgi:glycerate-2-kinase